MAHSVFATRYPASGFAGAVFERTDLLWRRGLGAGCGDARPEAGGDG